MTTFTDDLTDERIAHPLLPRIGLTTDDLNPYDPQHTRALRGHGGASSFHAIIIDHREGDRHVTRTWLGGRCVGEFYTGGGLPTILRTDAGEQEIPDAD